MSVNDIKGRETVIARCKQMWNCLEHEEAPVILPCFRVNWRWLAKDEDEKTGQIRDDLLHYAKEFGIHHEGKEA